MDIVAKAELVIKSLLIRDGNNSEVLQLKIGHIRKFLTAVNLVRNRVEIYKIQSSDPANLSTEIEAEIKFLKIKLAYQAGREKTIVKPFVEKAGLIQMIDSIGNSTERFDEFAKYVEALIAFHRFYGGKDR